MHETIKHNRSRSLGKGLGALLGQRDMALKADAADTVTSEASKILHLEFKDLKPGVYQPRRDAAQKDIESLAQSIKTQGVVQPILVRRQGECYEILAGERRFHAAKMAGLKSIPAIVKSVDDSTALIMGLIENLQRENLNPLEEAEALDRLSQEFNLTHQEISEAIGKSRVSVSQALRLLHLHPEVKSMLQHGHIEVGHAKVLLGLSLEEQCRQAQIIREQGYSVRALENHLSDQKQPSPKTARHGAVRAVDPDIRSLENRLSDRLGAKVRIKHQNTGRGALTVVYNSLDELEGILAHFQAEALQ